MDARMAMHEVLRPLETLEYSKWGRSAPVDVPKGSQSHYSHVPLYGGRTHQISMENPQNHHQQRLPSLRSVSSISPPNTSRSPIVDLAPLRTLQDYGSKQFTTSPRIIPSLSTLRSGPDPTQRPTLPPVRYDHPLPPLRASEPQSQSQTLSYHHHRPASLWTPHLQPQPRNMIPSMTPSAQMLPGLHVVTRQSNVSPTVHSPSAVSPTASSTAYSPFTVARSFSTNSSVSPIYPHNINNLKNLKDQEAHIEQTPSLPHRLPIKKSRYTTPTNKGGPPSSTASATAKMPIKCRREGCTNYARRKGLCMEHGGRHFCKMEGCQKCAHRGGFCISHGGGRRCAVENCAKSAQSGGICYSHGGGKRCATIGCTHAARSGGFCIKHGKSQQQAA